jgi:glycerol dehydrogenase
MLRTIGFPRRYSQGAGALSEIGPMLINAGYKRPICVVDRLAESSIWSQVASSLDAAGINPVQLASPGECTVANIDALVQQVMQTNCDLLIAFGGGKTIDLTKGVSRRLHMSIAICPTIASSDAPTSRLIVVYDEQHRLAGVEMLADNPEMILVDTAVIAKAPPRFFAAGIGDALSKRFEARQCLAAGGSNSFGTAPLSTALLLADAAYATLLAKGPNAYRAVQAKTVNQDVEDVVEATVLLSGIGFESGGLSLAHALIRGLTAIPAIADKLHGELVAYGTLVQLCFENRPDAEKTELLCLIESVNLPKCLADLGHEGCLTADQEELITSLTMATAYSANTAPRVTPSRLLESILEVEELCCGQRARVVN